MRKQEPLPVLVYSKEIEKAAEEHAHDLGEAGEASHTGKMGSNPSSRVAKHLKWTRMAAECIDVASKTAADIVASLIVDDGNEERSNRKVLFSRNVKLIGISCAPHKIFGTITVVDCVGGFTEPPPTGATPQGPPAETPAA